MHMLLLVFCIEEHAAVLEEFLGNRVRAEAQEPGCIPRTAYRESTTQGIAPHAATCTLIGITNSQVHLTDAV